MLIKDIFNGICKLKLVELTELLSLLEKQFSIKSINFNSKIENVNKNIKLYNLKLVSISFNKISIIKLFKSYFSCDIKTAKTYTDNLPKIILSNSSKDKVNDLFNKLKELGCTVEKHDSK